jgi:dynein heavy chain
MGKEHKKEAKKEEDIRPAWIKQRVQNAFGTVKGFDKLYATEENGEIITEWLADAHKRTLVFTETLVAGYGYSKFTGKTKTLAFVKRDGIEKSLTNNISNEVVVHETQKPVQELEKIVQEIYLPLLTNTKNQEGWGDVASKEIITKLHNFLSSCSITVGNTEGKTFLPLPPFEVSEDRDENKTRISLIESSIITWTDQIKKILKMDPEMPLKMGLNPTPDAEVDFWRTKSAHLNAIYDQLQSPQVRKLLRALDQANSTYGKPFASVIKEVFAARLEANDNTKYLRPLSEPPTEWFTKLNTETDFKNKLTGIFKPMLHVILLIWKNSKHYNTPERLVVLIREICNALINQASNYISGEEIFKLIEEEQALLAVERLKTTLEVCGAFKDTYADYRETANSECPHNQWTMQNTSLFNRLDSFMDRTCDIQDLVETIVQFEELAKIEVGGTKGKTLTQSAAHVYQEFQELFRKFEAVGYDIMDVGSSKFDDDFYEFRKGIKELERRLAEIIVQSFDDCSNLIARFKLLESFDALTSRPMIKNEMENKHMELVVELVMDLKLVNELFLASRDSPPVTKNLPKTVGALHWCRGMIDRVKEPMRKLEALNSEALMVSEQAQEAVKLYSAVLASLSDFEMHTLEDWGRDVESISSVNLNKPLLSRGADNKLAVNFDPALVRLLREVRYFLLCGIEVPTNVGEIFQKAEVFRQQTGQLDLMVDMYNHMLDTLLPVETPLVRTYFQNIDKLVQRGIGESGGKKKVPPLNWKLRNLAVDDSAELAGGAAAGSSS